MQILAYRRFRILAALCALALLVVACGGDDGGDTVADPADDATETPGDDDTENDGDDEPTAVDEGGELKDVLIIGLTQELVSLDPADSADTLGRDVISNYNASLYRDVPGEDPEPEMAAGPPEVSDDGLSYTVPLKDNIRFGDGLELTAPLYVELFQRQLTLGGLGPNLRIVPYVDRVEAPDDHTLVFHLKDNFAFFPVLLAYHPYSVGHPDIFPADELVPLPPAPIYGTGAYILADYTPDGEQLVFEPNPHYFGGEVPYDQVIVRRFADPATMALALANGEVDVAHKHFDEDQLPELEANPDIELGFHLSGYVLSLVTNHSLAPTDDKRVRQAVAATIDRSEISDRAFGGLKPPLYNPIPPGSLGHTEAFREAYDPPNPDLARELLTEAGYSEDNPVELVVAYPGVRYGEGSVDAMQLVREQLEATGMITVDLQTVEASAFFEGLLGGDAYNFGLLAKTAEPDPSGYTGLFVYDGGTGTGLTDAEGNPQAPAAEALLDQLALGASELDQDARDEHYHTLSEMWADEVVTLPIWLDPLSVARRTYVSGLPDLPLEEALHIGDNNVLYFDRVRAFAE